MYTNERIANYSRYRGVIDVKTEASPLQHVENSCRSRTSKNSDALLHSAWEEFLATTGPYSHLWTQSYMRPYGDRRAIDALWDCVKHVNRSLWGPRWVKGRKGIHATVVAERHKLSHELRGRLHFHVLVQKLDSDVSDERFSAVVSKAALWLRDDSQRPMSALERTDIRSVWNPQGLADYLTKDLKTPHWPKGDNIFFLRPTGPEGIVFHLKSNAEMSSLH